MLNKITSFIFLLSLSGCQNLSPCEDEVLQRYVNENKITAIQYIRDCGATTDYVTTIKLLDNKDEKIIFTAKGYHDKDIEIEWVDKENLKISFDIPKEDIFKKESNYHNININYESK